MASLSTERALGTFRRRLEKVQAMLILDPAEKQKLSALLNFTGMDESTYNDIQNLGLTREQKEKLSLIFNRINNAELDHENLPVIYGPGGSASAGYSAPVGRAKTPSDVQPPQSRSQNINPPQVPLRREIRKLFSKSPVDSVNSPRLSDSIAPRPSLKREANETHQSSMDEDNGLASKRVRFESQVKKCE